METQAEVGAKPDLPPVDGPETTQAAPTWPLIAVLAVALLLARAPAGNKVRNI